MNQPTALTIAGSDSIGGAGIQADLKTFEHFGVYGASAITLITAQNTRGVQEVNYLPRELIDAQIQSVITDIHIHSVKTGALGHIDAIDVVADAIAAHDFDNVVIDPVMVSKHGYRLIDEEAIKGIMSELIPLASIITPNIPEASVLIDRELNTLDHIHEAAGELSSRFGVDVLITGGSSTGEEAIDVLARGNEIQEYRSPRQFSTNTHGTGCTLSAAICALMATGYSVEESIGVAKSYVDRAMQNAPSLGQGIGPLQHRLFLGRRKNNSKK